MKNRSKIVWGLVWIAVGVLIALAHFDIITLKPFKGWWTLFIIVPGAIGLITERDKAGHFTTVCIGVALLLWQQGLFSFDMLFKIALPIAIICFGIRMLTRGLFGKCKPKKQEVSDEKESLSGYSKKKYFYLFGGDDIRLRGERLEELSCTTVFGGCDIDLRDAIFEQDCDIYINCVFGGVDVLLPSDVNCDVNTANCFGSVDERKNRYAGENAVTVRVHVVCVFSGVTIE